MSDGQRDAITLPIIPGLRFRQARLHARADNVYGAPRLYERFGFRPLKRFARYRKPLQLSWTIVGIFSLRLCRAAHHLG